MVQIRVILDANDTNVADSVASHWHNEPAEETARRNLGQDLPTQAFLIFLWCYGSLVWRLHAISNISNTLVSLIFLKIPDSNWPVC